MIAGTSKDANSLLEKRRGSGSKVGERIRRGIPESQQSLGGDRLAQAHQGLAAGKRKDFEGTAENRVCYRSESG